MCRATTDIYHLQEGRSWASMTAQNDLLGGVAYLLDYIRGSMTSPSMILCNVHRRGQTTSSMTPKTAKEDTGFQYMAL